ncbi:hypothetical protein JOF56_001772 [Kibdelosporangium banguiense]|uniref:Uncharacterized protein n=1 Tax=Kibdelosporangium banguiense TaxID=1365924 RepID=A0ABS4TAF1_9PSEU|nr:hypothetical protein [Kibdelosporangium banguiense]MBP2321387.1 hypothetical protein [Kibdelosporangium banguiense]
MTIDEYVDALVAKAPPLSERQRERLALIFATARIRQRSAPGTRTGMDSDVRKPRQQGVLPLLSNRWRLSRWR